MSSSPAPPRAELPRPALYTIVAISGGCVLAVEILGTRVLGPFYGVSLYLWSALISITLAALSVGYVLGGRLADRGPRATRLAAMLAIAGVWILAVPWMRDPLLALTEQWGLRVAVLTSAKVLFFPPLLLLGMVGPYAIRMSASGLQDVGRTAGDVFAISTVASVVAAVATGFWLIPEFGVSRLLVGIGVALLCGAAIALLAGGNARRATGGAAVLALAAGAVGWVLPRAEPKREAGVLDVRESPYAEIRVVDHRGLRHFLIDGGIHSVVVPETDASFHRYVWAAELGKEFFPAPGRLLLVGLGGGTLAKRFARDGWRVTAVEIDPAVPEVAREYFALRPEEAEIHIEDGRRWLATTGERFDLIFLDAFGSSSIPFHLISDEAFALAKSRLAPGGVIGINVEAVGWDHILVRSLGTTLKRHFGQVIALPTGEPPNSLGNIVIFAAERPLDFDEAKLGDPVAALVDEPEHFRIVQRIHAWDSRYEPDGGVWLTDDRNPCDVWAEGINRVARRQLHGYFAAHTSW